MLFFTRKGLEKRVPVLIRGNLILRKNEYRSNFKSSLFVYEWSAKYLKKLRDV